MNSPTSAMLTRGGLFGSDQVTMTQYFSPQNETPCLPAAGSEDLGLVLAAPTTELHLRGGGAGVGEDRRGHQQNQGGESPVKVAAVPVVRPILGFLRSSPIVFVRQVRSQSAPFGDASLRKAHWLRYWSWRT